MNGSETLSQGKIRLASSFEDMSRIEFTVDPGNRMMFGTTTYTLILNEYDVPVQNNETDVVEEEWAPTSIQTATVACESPTILTNKQTVDDPIECIVDNPNPFSINVVISITSSPSLFKTPGAIDIAANETSSISFVPKYEEALWDRQKDVDVEKEIAIQILTSSPDYDIAGEPVLDNTVITWISSLHVEEPVAEPEEKSSSNTTLYTGIGAVVVLLAIVGYVILNRRASAAFEDEAFYDEEPDNVEQEVLDLPEGKPLDAFEDKTISEEPEVIERPGDALISEVDDSEGDVVETSAEHAEEDSTEEEQEDDGITVDEYGTEWYEDELGTWWYREAGAEDWSEYNE